MRCHERLLPKRHAQGTLRPVAAFSFHELIALHCPQAEGEGQYSPQCGCTRHIVQQGFLSGAANVRQVMSANAFADQQGACSCTQEVQQGVSAAFPHQGPAQAPASAPAAPSQPTQEPPSAPQSSTSSNSRSSPEGSGPSSNRNSPHSSSPSPRLLWSEQAELAEARERCEWHEVMSRRNGGEHTERLQVCTHFNASSQDCTTSC